MNTAIRAKFWGTARPERTPHRAPHGTVQATRLGLEPSQEQPPAPCCLWTQAEQRPCRLHPALTSGVKAVRLKEGHR